MIQDYADKPRYTILKFKPYLLCGFLGIKHRIKIKLSNLFRSSLTYNGQSSLESNFWGWLFR